jgi:hypothetical protein
VGVDDLFSLFINELCKVVHFARYHAYDFQLYSSGCYNDISICILRLNGILGRVYRWSIDNGLVLNGSKTQAIIFSRNVGRFPSPLPELTLGGEAIVYSACFKNLDIFMEDRCPWKNNVSHARKNVKFVLSWLWHFADITQWRLVCGSCSRWQSLYFYTVMWCSLNCRLM